MKTCIKDFTPAAIPQVENNDNLRELICTRHEKYRVTTEYLKAKEEAMAIFEKLENLLPEEHRAFGRLEDAFFWMEHLCYGAGYNDGVTDLMTTMTFNKLGLTKVEYCDLSKGA